MIFYAKRLVTRKPFFVSSVGLNEVKGLRKSAAAVDKIRKRDIIRKRILRRKTMVDKIEIRGAKVHNLKNIDVDVPLNKIVGIAGVSGSGKSSLALGVLYAEGSRRYLDALSTYTRRRISQSEKANVDVVLHVPSALALHQRPSVPSIRSTFGTQTELLNSVRLLFSRCGNYRCPNGHLVPATSAVAKEVEIVCPECGETFYGLGAEEYAFNSSGACPCCQGTGVKQTVDMDSLVPNENLSVDEGAVAPWNSLMWSLMKDVCHAMGVRTEIPYKDLTPEEKQIVLDGPMEKKHIFYQAKKQTENVTAGELDFTYYSAKATVLNALKKVKDEKSMARVSKFLKMDVCPECLGTRLNQRANSTLFGGKTLSEVCKMNLLDLTNWLPKVVDALPSQVKQMGENILEEFMLNAKVLLSLGLGYLTLERASNTLSTGELQRVQLARTVRNRTTGVLYVLDEPSIGLHPNNVEGLITLMKQLVLDGNSVVLVDHDAKILSAVDHLIEIGEKAGKEGGRVIFEGSVEEAKKSERSIIGRFLKGEEISVISHENEIFSEGKITLKTREIHTVKPLEVSFPKNRLTVVTGVSGSGKTTLVLDSLYPALRAKLCGEKMPSHVIGVEAEGIHRVNLIDATPIGANVRSTVSTYSGVLDDIRKLFQKASGGKYSHNDFSYNTGKLRCPVCDGTGSISLDVQFLPDVQLPCEACRGLRYSREAEQVKFEGKSIQEILSLTIDEAKEFFAREKKIQSKLSVLSTLGIGYLTLGEATPLLSGGEAQRLKLAAEIDKLQDDALFIFDEPSVGLHPLDVKNLLTIFEKLLKSGATIVVIEHDTDIMKNADYLIDMGPLGGELGGKIVAAGTKEELIAAEESLTGKYLR